MNTLTVNDVSTLNFAELFLTFVPAKNNIPERLLCLLDRSK